MTIKTIVKDMNDIMEIIKRIDYWGWMWRNV